MEAEIRKILIPKKNLKIPDFGMLWGRKKKLDFKKKCIYKIFDFITKF